ncbi:MAG: outer membrane beta-barrel protein [Bacteroidales bacterium]|nr:outer membrane beta-barrel protein [Bacteroidales bacterium]
MKQFKLLLVSLLVFGLSFNSFAGDKFGIRAGWQFSNFHNSSSSPAFTIMDEYLNSFYIGIFKEHKIIPLFRLGGGLEYSQIGSAYDSDNLMKLHYLSLPIYAKIKLGPVYGLLGGAPAFKVGETWKLDIGADASKELFNANTFDLPVFAGLGFNILMLRIEARYYWGTMDVSGNALFSGYKSQQFQLGLGIAI